MASIATLNLNSLSRFVLFDFIGPLVFYRQQTMSVVQFSGSTIVYYLNAFKRILKKDTLKFIFGGGAGNMPFVGTILHGWGANVIYLYDNDQGKKDGEKN